MDFQTPGAWDSLRSGIRELCSEFGDTYWQELDHHRAYPLEFVQALGQAGWLSTLIPTEYNGGGMGLVETSIVLEEINRSGGNANAAHAQVYLMAVSLRHASENLKRTYLPQITAGKLRLQAFAVTEPNAGSETTRIETTAVRNGDTYIINGSKMFISRVEQSDLMLILARTTAYDEVVDKTTGLSLFLTDLRRSKER
jgi:acyl-CoA dehydrogenase